MRSLPLVLTASLVIVSCGGDVVEDGGKQGESSAAPVAQADFPARFAAALCDQLPVCCQAANLPHDPAACAKQGESMRAGFQKAAAIEGVAYDPVAGGKCIELLRSAVAQCTPSAAVVEAYEDACRAALFGTKPAGAPCSKSAQCARPAGAEVSCSSGTGSSYGGFYPGGFGAGGAPVEPPPPTCQITQPAPHGKEGEGCNSTCISTGTGTSCSISSGSLGPSSGTAICYRNEGLFCDSMGRTCTPLRAVGQPCAAPDDCALDAACSVGTCVARQALGGACGPHASPFCAQGLVCEQGTCAALRKLGEACTKSSQCEERCNNGKCSPRYNVASPSNCSGASNGADDDEATESFMGTAGAGGAAGGSAWN